MCVYVLVFFSGVEELICSFVHTLARVESSSLR